MNRFILLIGLDPASETFASTRLAEEGHRVISASGLSEARRQLALHPIDFVYLYQEAGEAASLEEIRGLRPGCPVVLVCPATEARVVLDAWHKGASDVIFLPLTAEALESSLARAPAPAPAGGTERNVQARLRYLDETGKERSIAVIPPVFKIGRKSDNDLVLQKLNVSRSHAEICCEGGLYRLRDLGSKHGTFLNGARIDEADLKNGDRIQLGGVQGPSISFHRGDLLRSLLSNTSDPETSLPVRGFREMAMLISTFRALSSISLLDDLLNLVVDTAIDLTGAERGFIMLKDPDGSLSFRCARNAFRCPLDGSSFQTSRRVPEEVFQNGSPIVINDLDMDDGGVDHSATRSRGLRSISCVPLRYLAFHDTNMSVLGVAEIIGVLYVDSQNRAEAMTEAQVDPLNTLASEAAMAIYNARLYRDSQEKRKLEEELAIAREIQQALLPAPGRDLPFLAACSRNLPCREVGGDYFDYFDLDQGRFGFALGDVAGKGMPAALLAAVLQGIFAAQTLLDLPLPKLISNVNRHLVKRGTGSRFVTFFFGTLDADGNCTYVNAGHNPPLIVRRDGSLVELTEGGTVLGLFASAEYTSGKAKLEPGDHLALFTDGVLEARDTAGEEFGEERLESVLKENAAASAEQISERLHDAIAAFAAGAPQHDDITMMVIGFRESKKSEKQSAPR